MDFTELKFLVLDELMEKAGEMDEEIRLVKSSKEGKQKAFEEARSGKRKRGEMKWKDPW